MQLFVDVCGTCETLFVAHARKNVQTHSRALAVQRDYIYGVVKDVWTSFILSIECRTS